MGCRFEITAVAESDSIAWQAVREGIAEIDRIEKLISSWDENSQTSAINRAAGVKAVSVDQELYNLIYRSLKVAKLTGGAFDISFASMERIWKFDRTEQVLPDSGQVKDAVALVNWQNIELGPESYSVFLKKQGMKIGFGGIGKGYAANRARSVMESIPGVKGGVVNASGDLMAWGESGKPEGWTIQVADPKNIHRPIASLSLVDQAIVTSGDYEKYFTCGGRRYAHIIDPSTGYPTTGIKSVTVICPDAELADALATSIFVMGREEGLDLVNQLNQVECIIITDDDAMHTSDHLKLNYL